MLLSYVCYGCKAIHPQGGSGRFGVHYQAYNSFNTKHGDGGGPCGQRAPFHGSNVNPVNHDASTPPPMISSGTVKI